MPSLYQVAVARLQAAYQDNNIPPIDPNVLRGKKICEIITLAEHWEARHKEASETVDLKDLVLHAPGHTDINVKQHRRCERDLPGANNVDGKFKQNVYGLGAIALRDDGGNWA